REIPYGQTRSYSEIARAIGAPRAVRAVASACANNRVAVVIPCHRAIRADGAPRGLPLGARPQAPHPGAGARRREPRRAQALVGPLVAPGRMAGRTEGAGGTHSPAPSVRHSAPVAPSITPCGRSPLRS